MIGINDTVPTYAPMMEPRRPGPRPGPSCRVGGGHARAGPARIANSDVRGLGMMVWAGLELESLDWDGWKDTRMELKKMDGWMHPDGVACGPRAHA